MLSQIWCVKPQGAHSWSKMFRELARTMARNDLGQDFLVHKTPSPIARRALLIREKFFDVIVIQRTHGVQRWTPV